MRRFAASVAVAALVASFAVAPARADICSFAYTGMMNTEVLGTSTYKTSIYVNQIFDNYGLSMDTVTWHFQADTHGLDITSGLNNYVLNRNAKVILDLSHMLFYRQDGTTTCSGYGGATVAGKDLAYANWQSRLDTFVNTNAADLVPSKVRMIVIHAEANNACANQGVIDQMAYRLKNTHGITIPLAEGLPTTYVNSSYHAQPLPTNKPWWIDYIVTWSYGVWAPENPTHPRNANEIYNHNQIFFDPTAPYDPTTLWGGLMAWKRPNQKVLFVVDSHCTDFLHAAIGWSVCQNGNIWELGIVANNFRAWALNRPEIDQMVAFTWPSPDTDKSDGKFFFGAREMGAGTQGAHQDIADEAFLCEP